MHIQRWPHAAAFLERAGSFLEQREAAHNILLGLSAELVVNPQLFGREPPYFATAEIDGTVVLAMLRTPPHPLSISYAAPNVDDSVFDALVDDLATDAINLNGVSGPSEATGRFAARWCSRTNQTSRVKVALRIYQLTRVDAPSGIPGALRQANEGDRALLATWFGGFQEDAFGEPFDDERANASVQRWLTTPGRSLYLWEIDQQPVSMAGTGGPTPHGIRVSAVFTPRELRGRGYASACVAAASQAQLDQGRSFCSLFTDLANPTSNKIYQQIGYRPVCDAEEVAFESA
ncbi:MAG: GNAT family N-acetyltransferase [Roseiflexaceae bacterium]|nr:GNAT family N-acetyltransferase [Roseiflexaceae bacterium]